MTGPIGTAYVEVKGDLTQLNRDVATALAPANMSKAGKMAGVAMGGALAAGLAVAGIGKLAYDLGAEFDDAFDKIRVGTGKTGKPLKQLEKDFKSVFASIPTDAGTAADAIAGLNQRLGLTGKPLRSMARNIVELSRLTKTDLEGNIKSVSRAFVDWEVPVKKQTKTLDGLFRLYQKSGASVSDLTSDVQKFGSPLRTLGFDLGEAASMFANFERAGVNSQTMVPGFKLAIGNLVAPTKDLKGTFEQLGVAVGDPKKGLRQIMDLMGNQSDLSKVEKMSLAMDVFGKRAGADMAEAIKQGRFNLKPFIKEFEDGTDTIKKSAQDTNDTGENLKKFGNTMKVIFEPLGTLVFKAVGKVSEALAGLPLQKYAADIQRFTKHNQDFKDVLKAVAVGLKAFGRVAEFAFDNAKEAWKGAWTYIKGSMQVMRGTVKVVSGVIKGDWGKAWDGIKDIFRGSAKVVLGVVRAMSTPLRKSVSVLGGLLSKVFGGAWDKVEGIFETGGNAVISVVNKIIDAINAIPGLPNIDAVGMIEGPQTKAQKTFNTFQRGGPINLGKPSGDSVPALLERGEYVLNREAVKAVGKDKLDHLNFKKASRFQVGGPVGLINGGDVWDAAKGAAGDLVGKGASFFMDRLPKPNIPEPLTPIGPYLIDAAKEYIKGKVKGPADGGGPLGGATGNLAAAMQMATSHGLTITSTTGGTHAPGSYHYLGRAFDASNGSSPTPEMMSYFMDASSKWGGSITELFYDPVGWYIKYGSKVPGAIGGHSDHVHTAFQKGGSVLRKMAMGGGVNINRTFPGAMFPSSAWNALPELSFNVAAALAEAAGDWAGTDMPGVTFAQMSQGEGALKPGSMGDDNGDGSPDGYGWLAITRPYGDSYGVSKYGGYEKMLNPVLNAAVAAKMFGSQGTGAWYGDRFVTDKNAHYTGPYDIRKSLGGKTFAQAVGDPGSGGSVRSAAQIEARKRKNRIENRTTLLDRLRGRVKDSDSPLGKKGALWKLIQTWANFGDLEGEDKSTIIDKVRKASAMANPTGGIPILQNLAEYLHKNVDVSGEEDGNEKFVDRLAKVKENSTDRGTAKRSRLFKKMANRGIDFPLLDKLNDNADILNVFGERIDIRESLASAESGPGGSEFTDAELSDVTDQYQGKLALQQDRKRSIMRSIGYLSNVRDSFAEAIKKASPKASATHWKLPGFRKGFKAAKESLSELRTGEGNLTDLAGFTGKGGDIFETKLKLADLGVTVTSEGAALTASDSEVAALLKEQLAATNRSLAIMSAQQPIYEQFKPKFHSGGTVQGPIGSEVDATLLAGETVRTREQEAALRSSQPIQLTVIVEDGAVDSNKIKAAANEALVDVVRKVRTGGPTAGKAYSTNG